MKVAIGLRSVMFGGLRAGYVYFDRRFLVSRILHWSSLPLLRVTHTSRVIGNIYYRWISEVIQIIGTFEVVPSSNMACAEPGVSQDYFEENKIEQVNQIDNNIKRA